MNLSTLTTDERERLAYSEGYIETASLLAELSDAEQERDALAYKNENRLPVRYFIVDYDLDDGPDLVEVDENDFVRAEGAITYERHTMRENGCDQICLTKGLDS